MKNFYLNLNAKLVERNKLDSIQGEKSKVLFKNSEEIPEGDSIILLQGVFSQNFEVGKKSRNGYKYDQKGWFIDHYKLNPIILWQHNDDYGGIGEAQELWLDSNNNLCGLFYVDLETLEERNAKQIKKGLVKGISTGATTIEAMFEENETGKRYTRDEAIDKFGFNNVIDCLWGEVDAILTYVITKAELVENSIVTIGSNFGALSKQVNGIEQGMKDEAEKLLNEAPNEVKNLFSKNRIMKKKNNNVKDGEEVKTETPNNEAGTTPEAPAETEGAKVEPTTGDGTQAEPTKGEVGEETNKVSLEMLNTNFKELQNSFEEYKKSMDAKIEEFKQSNTNLREIERDKLLKNAPKITENGSASGESEVKDIKSFMNKHKRD